MLHNSVYRNIILGPNSCCFFGGECIIFILSSHIVAFFYSPLTLHSPLLNDDNLLEFNVFLTH